MADQDVDRSEAATPFKLEKAREQGQTARSADLVSAIVFLVAMTYVAWQGMAACETLLKLARTTLAQAGQVHAAGLWPLAAQLVSAVAATLLPPFAALLIAASLASVAQTGVVCSFAPVRIDFSRVSPATGLKRLFSSVPCSTARGPA